MQGWNRIEGPACQNDIPHIHGSQFVHGPIGSNIVKQRKNRNPAVGGDFQNVDSTFHEKGAYAVRGGLSRDLFVVG